MSKRQRQKKRILVRKIMIGMLILVVLVLGGFYIYTLDYYRAEPEVEIMMEQEPERISSRDDLTVVFPASEAGSGVGLIFYPGGKVEASAYLPLLKQISEEGITCVLTEMPFNLAVFNADAADKVYAAFPEIDHWFLAGHSLGGAMASSYVEKNAKKLDGLILMGAYPINDAPLPTLAIYGTEDIQLDLAKMRTAEQVVIAGGNHAYFGNYGEQEGDGVATISREKQQAIAVDAIVQFVQEAEK